MSNKPIQPERPDRRGVMFVVSSPSGAGKTTLTRRMLKEMNGVELSISATTREMRPDEKDGVHYYFKTREEFERLIEEDELLEWAEVFGNYYGTPRGEVERLQRKGTDVLFDVDWQGARVLKQVMPGDVVSVFILPPSISELKSRLEGRPGANPDAVMQRLSGAGRDIKRWGEYDFVIINDDIEIAYDELCAILVTERLDRRKPSQGARVDKLLDDAEALES
ncbi:guanylate kinase [Hirschia maritima]|uniref:guanylate kinase n=1 Tax=Hirschia maritima TaxID=1121961 RepID=UPI00036C034A|nr:guanylate kinase [Hirschia maritima]